MPYIICTTCRKRFFGDAYLSLEDLQEDIVVHMREEHGIEFQVDPDLTWGDILKMCLMPFGDSDVEG
jgi:hypothetical protein